MQLELFTPMAVQVSETWLARLWARVADRIWKVDPFSGCWLCDLWLDGHGYPRGVARLRVRRDRRASWISYWMHNGPVPAGAFVLHRCDVRSCVNPGHLFLGDQAANMADMVAKGRSLRGRKVPRLTVDQVRDIRGSRETLAELAERLGVCIDSVWKARRGLTWRHIDAD